MKKHVGTAALAAVLAAVSTSSFATDPGAFFINGNLGQSNFHDQGDFNSNNTDTSATLRAGYYWQSDVVDFGVEGGYASMGSAKGSLAGPNLSTLDYSAKVTGPLAGATIKYKFQNRMFLSARAGYFGSNIKLGVDGFGSQSKSEGGSYIGAGAGYDITPQFSLGVNWDEYRARASFYGIGTRLGISSISGFAEYRF